MMVFGKTIWLMGEVGLFTIMETIMMVDGKMGRITALAYFRAISIIGMKGCGRIIRCTVMERKHGQITPYMKENTRMDSNMEKVKSLGPIRRMKENLEKMYLKDRASINGQMATSIKVSS